MKKYILFILFPLITSCKDGQIKQAVNQGLADGLYSPNHTCVAIQKTVEIDPTLVNIMLPNLKNIQLKKTIEENDRASSDCAGALPSKNKYKKYIGTDAFIEKMRTSDIPTTPAAKAKYVSFDEYINAGDTQSTPAAMANRKFADYQILAGSLYTSTVKNCRNQKESIPIYVTYDSIAQRINLPFYSNTLFYKVYQDKLDIKNKDIYNLLSDQNLSLFSNESEVILNLTQDEKQGLVDAGQYKTLRDVPNSIKYKFLGIYYDDKLKPDSSIKFVERSDLYSNQEMNDSGSFLDNASKLGVCFYQRDLIKIKDYLSIDYSDAQITNKQEAVRVFFTYKFDYPSWVRNSNMLSSQGISPDTIYSAKTLLIKTDNGYRDINQM